MLIATPWDVIMEFAAGPPSRWILTLKSGSEIEIWADSYSDEGDHYRFDAYVRASLDEQRQVEVTSRSPGRAENVLIVVARVPVAEVESLYGGPVDPAQEDPTP
ncbi:hypothetical protein [Actinomadura logoneensis]|uniref:hypothetical protein n=1 Tax=Actinomadura logoneensis TaxID=2293572 RepID=UPI0011C11910|nr:hypothetical protein [Actinomadura logoneensis]